MLPYGIKLRFGSCADILPLPNHILNFVLNMRQRSFSLNGRERCFFISDTLFMGILSSTSIY